MDVQLEQLRIGPAAAGAPPGDLPLIDFCAPPEASAALRAGGGPLVDLLTNTPGAERGAAAKPPLEAGQVRPGRPAASVRVVVAGFAPPQAQQDDPAEGPPGFEGPQGSASSSVAGALRSPSPAEESRPGSPPRPGPQCPTDMVEAHGVRSEWRFLPPAAQTQRSRRLPGPGPGSRAVGAAPRGAGHRQPGLTRTPRSPVLLPCSS